MKECGVCTLCCLLLPIPEINSDHSKICSQCDSEVGCKIYETRPQSCKNFKCSWLLDEEMSDDLRPDKCNVIFDKINDVSDLALVHFDDLIAPTRKPVVDYIKTLNEKGISVIISSYTSEPKRYMLADGHTEEYIFNGAMDELKKDYK